MRITSSTYLLGLIGWPVRHSLSPLMHNYFFKVNKLDAVYLCFEVKPQDLRKAIQGVRALGLKGLNVTIPHKEAVIKYLDGLDKEAELIGAVNTIKNKEGRLIGYNTDGLGFIYSLEKKKKFSVKSKRVFILGAGGAARAVSCYLARKGAAYIGFYDIDMGKARRLSLRLRRFYRDTFIEALKRLQDIKLKEIDLLVNATGSGRKRKDHLPLSLKGASRELLVYDLIYNPSLPKLLQEAQRRGLPILNGLWMLIYQGLGSLSIWFDKDFQGKEKILLEGIKRYSWIRV